MYLYNVRPFSESLQAYGASKWTAFLFTGAVPTTQAAIPFDDQNLDELFANAVAIDNMLFDTSYEFGNSYAAFKAGDIGNNAGAYYMDLAKGKWRVRSDSKFGAITDYSVSGKHLGFCNDGELYCEMDTAVNDVFEFDLAGSADITEVEIDINATESAPTTIGIEAYVTDSWVEVGELITPVVGVNTVAVTTTTDKMRLVHKVGAATKFQLRGFKAFADVEPAFDNTIDAVTWAIVRPLSPTAQHEKSGNEDHPFFFMTAGNPSQSSTDLTINRINVRAGDTISVINCKIRNEIWEA